MNERIPLAALVPLRLLCGLVLVLAGWAKLQGGWLHGNDLLAILDGWLAAGKPYHFFQPVVSSAHAHPKIFGALVTAGELVVGATMVLGLLTRLSAFLGAVLMFSIFFASGDKLTPPSSALLLGAVFVIFLFVPPGRVLGLDAALRARLPRWVA